MKYNLHTHSFYCRHGEGTIQEFVDKAIEDKFELLGFSEHCPYPDRILEDNNSRMYYPLKPYYEKDVREVKTYDRIKILLGYECDIWPNHDQYLKDTVASVDYCIFGAHFLPGADGLTFTPFNNVSMQKKGNLRIYADAYIKAIDMGIFLFGAHPDVFMYGFEGKWDKDKEIVSKDILQAAREKDLPLEVNLNGIAKAFNRNQPIPHYPCRQFWEMAKDYSIRCVISSDAHSPANLSLHREKLLAFVDDLKLKTVEPVFQNNKIVLQ